MIDPEREPLSGVVEVDETIIPFRTKNDPIVVPAGRSGSARSWSPAWSKSTAARRDAPGCDRRPASSYWSEPLVTRRIGDNWQTRAVGTEHSVTGVMGCTEAGIGKPLRIFSMRQRP
jgi:hypothetical protein